MLPTQKTAKIYFRPELYQLLLLKARENDESLSDLVNEVLQRYFKTMPENVKEQRNTFVAQEAHRQSLLVSQHHDPSSEIWEKNIDDSDWRG